MSGHTSKSEEKENEWYREYEKQQAELVQRRFELFKKQMAKDPFGMLFGKAVERSINPWASLNWLLASKAGKEGAAGEAASTKDQPLGSDKAMPSTNAAKSSESPGQTSTKEQQVGGTVRAHSTSSQNHESTSTATRPNVDTANTPILIEDYEIDPITLRKVHKIHKEPSPPRASINAAVDIPVKTFEDGMSRSFLLSRKHDAIGTAEQIPSKPSNEFKPITPSKVVEKMSSARPSGQTWLAHEGFGERPLATEDKGLVPSSGPLGTEMISPAKASPTKLENSLDRYLRSTADEPKLGNRDKTSRQLLDYRAGVNRAEDIDLLRASDVRASYGHVAKSGTETDAEKQERRRRIEADYQKRLQSLETQYAEELAAEEAREARAKAEAVNAEDEPGITPQGLEASYLNEISSQEPQVAKTEPWAFDLSSRGPETLYQREMDNRMQSQENSYARNLEAASMQKDINDSDVNTRKVRFAGAKGKIREILLRQIRKDETLATWLRIAKGDCSVPPSSNVGNKKREAAEQALAEEVKVQKAAMAAIENRKTVDSSKGASAMQHMQRGEGDMSANVHEFGGRDRWYKNKAPHAVKDQAQRLRDRDLIREIRGIYEDAYGTIDTKHRQVSKSPYEEKPNLEVSQAVEQYENELGPDTQGLNVTRGSVEAGPIAKSANGAMAEAGEKAQEEMMSPSKKLSSDAHESGLNEEAPTALSQALHGGEHQSPEALAKRWEEEEQKLHNEIREAKDLIYKARTTISTLEKLDTLLGASKTNEQYTLQTLRAAEEAFRHAKISGRKSNETAYRVTVPESTAESPSAPLGESPTLPAPTMYKILAYDPSTEKISIATTTSSSASPNEAPLSVSEALSRLSSPARFLPYFPALRLAGYEIASGSGDVLVFKKVRDAAAAAAPTDEAVLDDLAPVHVDVNGNRIQTSKLTSPTPSNVTQDAVFSPVLSTSPSGSSAPSPPSRLAPPNSTDKVRREEAVFSGSQQYHWNKHRHDGAKRHKSSKGRVRRAAKRVLWVGVWTAGCCYAVGVVAEYFRTGGASGLGPQGF